jgi:hypothetical protein
VSIDAMSHPEQYSFVYEGEPLWALLDHDAAVALYETSTGQAAPDRIQGGNTLVLSFTLPQGAPALFVLQHGFEESEGDYGQPPNGAAVYAGPRAETLQRFVNKMLPPI